MFATGFPVVASAAPASTVSVLHEGAVTTASIENGVAIAPSVALMSAAFADTGQPAITIAVAPLVTSTATFTAALNTGSGGLPLKFPILVASGAARTHTDQLTTG